MLSFAVGCVPIRSCFWKLRYKKLEMWRYAWDRIKVPLFC